MRLPPPVCETPGCTVYWQGGSPLSQAECRFEPQARLSLPAAERRGVDAVWRGLPRRGKRVEDLPLYPLLSFQVLEARLLWEFGLTSYREYKGANVHRPAWALRDPDDKMANAQGDRATRCNRFPNLLQSASNVSAKEPPWAFLV